MSLEILKSAGAPQGIGPYSHGTKCGDIIIASGQIPIGQTKNEMVTEIKHATQIILSIVDAGDGRLDTVDKVEEFVRSLNDFAAINGVEIPM